MRAGLRASRGVLSPPVPDRVPRRSGCRLVGGCGGEEAPVFTAVLLFWACWQRVWTAGAWVPHLGESLPKLLSCLSRAMGGRL